MNETDTETNPAPGHDESNPTKVAGPRLQPAGRAETLRANDRRVNRAGEALIT